ncbi:MAG: regulatory iron-sulfur-containing complex subunit RicT [Pseudomonadota bacterium]
MSPKTDHEYHSIAALGADAKAQASGAARLASVVRVRLERSRRAGTYLACSTPVQPGDLVVVEAERGTAIGKVLENHTKAWLSRTEKPFRVVRRFGEKDLRSRERQVWRENKFRRDCAEAAAEMGLDLKVADAEYLHWENRVVFYFVSEGRVDFRDLVRDLSRKLRSRVEMRQIGPRDETRLLGGVGTCGREFCCATHLKQFESIRIRMVKDQGLVLNPQKVSGGCGKLKCCLAYEVDVYRELRKGMPSLGKFVQTPDGDGKVREVNVLSRKVGVLVEGAGYKTYPVALLANREGVPYDPEGKVALEARAAEERVRVREMEQLLIAPPTPGRGGEPDGGEGGEQKKRRSRRRRGRGPGGEGEGQPREGQPRRDGPGRQPRPPSQPPRSDSGQQPRSDQPDQGGEAAKKKRRSRRRRGGRRPDEQGGGQGPPPASG